MVLTENVNENGIYAVQFFVMGYRTVYTVDDYFPVSWWGDLGMAKISEDGGVWNPIMEKAAAKMFGTYDNLASGSSSAAIYWLTGMPGSQYSTNPSNPQATKDHLQWAIVDHTFVTVAGSHGSSDSQLSANGVVLNHAYNVFGMQDIIKDNGQTVTLLKLRNPWGAEEYLGPWSDSSNLWTDYTMSQVDYVDSNNGEFFIDLDTFVTEFGTYDISFYEPGMQKSLFYVDHFDWDTTYTFMFTL